MMAGGGGQAIGMATPEAGALGYFLRSLRFQQEVGLSAFSLVIGISVV
jgi:hypothetical protein